MKLELENARQEVARVRNICGDVVLRAGVEELFAALAGRLDALIFTPQFPPGAVLIGRRDLAGEHAPAPLVHQHAEREERDLVERVGEQQRDVR